MMEVTVRGVEPKRLPRSGMRGSSQPRRQVPEQVHDLDEFSGSCVR